MFKVRCFLLGAKGIEKGKDGKLLDLCLVNLLVQDKDSALISAEFFYGTASQVKGINALVANNGAMPVPIDADFAFDKFGDKVSLRLLNFVPVKAQ